ncbi:MAG: MBL fold metallo-hydrolase [Bacteroidales bacterium]|nr:MBL fold metallo-hydrolase [Bacteroidales bacterium]
MIQIKVFVFNVFSVNTLVLYDETKECVIIDPGCSTSNEQQELQEFITEHRLKPVHLLNTHYHIDHILGNKWVKETYQIVPEAHAAGQIFWGNKKMWSTIFHINEDDLIPAEKYLSEQEIIHFGNSSLQVIETPGHADGSLSFYSSTDHFVIVGDVLFLQSVGRSDLPTGNFDILKQQIQTKLFVLPDNTKVIPGHGPFTEIGFEKKSNPYL